MKKIILNIVQENEGILFKQIQEVLVSRGFNLQYSGVVRHLKNLEREGLIKVLRIKNKSGRPSMAFPAVVTSCEEILLKRYASIPYKIIGLLRFYKELNISQIQNYLGISYKETFRNIENLIKIGLVNKTKGKSKHNPSLIRIKGGLK